MPEKSKLPREAPGAPFLGIDPSKTCTAFAWKRNGKWRCVENKGTEYAWMRRVIHEAHYSGCRVAILEDGYLGRNAHTAKILDQLRGRIQEMCEFQGFEVIMVHPRTWHVAMLTVNGHCPTKRPEIKAASIFSATIMGADLATETGRISNDKADAVNISEWGRLNRDLL